MARKENIARTCGDKDQYVPGIKTTEIPSKGKTYRVFGATTNRVHHLLSSLEYAFFLYLDYDREVSDIKEQYLLPIRETVLIAAKAGIKPPAGPNGIIVHTSTDFFFCRKGVWHARSVKPSDALSDRRTREKLEIERLYWEAHGIDWKLITEKELDFRYARAVEWVCSGTPLDLLIPDEQQRLEACMAFLECYKIPTISFPVLTEYFTHHYSLEIGGGLQIFKHLILTGQLCVDLTSPYLLTDPRRCTKWGGSHEC